MYGEISRGEPAICSQCKLCYYSIQGVSHTRRFRCRRKHSRSFFLLIHIFFCFCCWEYRLVPGPSCQFWGEPKKEKKIGKSFLVAPQVRLYYKRRRISTSAPFSNSAGFVVPFNCNLLAVWQTCDALSLNHRRRGHRNAPIASGWRESTLCAMERPTGSTILAMQ